MRADRLLSLLMLLQARGRMTAEELARELEVSPRTIYRDIDALGAAGVPVYAEIGREGGYALLDSYRTNLTGLKEDEARALFTFLLNIPSPLADLGMSQKLKTVVLKLSAALPAARRSEEEQVRQRIHIDSVSWFNRQEPVPHLQAIQEAIWLNRRIVLSYRLWFGSVAGQVAAPYGLVAKAGTWYLVYEYQGRLQARRISELLDVRLTDEPFERPEDFALAKWWSGWCAEVEEHRAEYAVTARVAPALIPLLPRYFGRQVHELLAQAALPDADGWVTLTLPFERLEDARERLLGFGGAVEVLAPRALRESVADFARQTARLYAPRAEAPA